MARQFFLLIVSVFLSCGLAAQDQPDATPTVDPDCLLNTDASVWLALDISTEQFHQLQGLQTACETDCTLLKRGDDHAVTLVSTVKVYQEKVRHVLGEEKYQRWVQWCTERPVKG